MTAAEMPEGWTTARHAPDDKRKVNTAAASDAFRRAVGLLADDESETEPTPAPVRQLDRGAQPHGSAIALPATMSDLIHQRHAIAVAARHGVELPGR
jgi:hypothetical protein